MGSVSSDWAVPVETGFQTQIQRERERERDTQSFSPKPEKFMKLSVGTTGVEKSI